jgi:tetratricopeptide (TPR) repeat protein
MKFKKIFYLSILVFVLTVWAPFVSSRNFSAHAQNRISGFVFGLNRQPLADLDVELQDDYYRTVARTRTNSSGRYTFSGMKEGRFTIRVITSGTDYDERQNVVEIINFTGEDRQGNLRTTGHASEQSDFYLKLRKGVTAANVVVFAQEIPPDAKTKYEKAVVELDSGRVPEALSALRASLEIFPAYYDALERLGVEYIKLGRPETFRAATIIFTKAVEVNPRGYKSWYGRAYAQYSLGKFAEAVVDAKTAIELRRNAAEAVFLYGVLMKKTGKYDEAEKQLLKAKDLADGSIPSIHWELATLYGNHLNRYADAAKELKLFIKAQPDSKDAENIRKLIVDFEAKAKKK